MIDLELPYLKSERGNRVSLYNYESDQQTVKIDAVEHFVEAFNLAIMGLVRNLVVQDSAAKYVGLSRSLSETRRTLFMV